MKRPSLLLSDKEEGDATQAPSSALDHLDAPKRFFRECETHASEGHVREHVGRICVESVLRIDTIAPPPVASTAFTGPQSKVVDELSSDEEIVETKSTKAGTKLEGQTTHRGQTTRRGNHSERTILARKHAAQRMMSFESDPKGQTKSDQVDEPPASARRRRALSPVDATEVKIASKQFTSGSSEIHKRRTCDDDRTPIRERPPSERRLPSHRGAVSEGASLRGKTQLVRSVSACPTLFSKTDTTSQNEEKAAASLKESTTTSSSQVAIRDRRWPRQVDQSLEDDGSADRAREATIAARTDVEPLEGVNPSPKADAPAPVVDGQLVDCSVDSAPAERAGPPSEREDDFVSDVKSFVAPADDGVVDLEPVASPAAALETSSDLENGTDLRCEATSANDVLMDLRFPQDLPPPPPAAASSNRAASPDFDCPLPSQRLPAPSDETGYVDDTRKESRRRSIKNAANAMIVAGRMSTVAPPRDFDVEVDDKQVEQDVVAERRGRRRSIRDVGASLIVAGRMSVAAQPVDFDLGASASIDDDGTRNQTPAETNLPHAAEDRHRNRRHRHRHHHRHHHHHGSHEEVRREANVASASRAVTRVDPERKQTREGAEGTSEAGSETPYELPVGVAFAVDFFIDDIQHDAPGFAIFKFKKMAGIRLSQREPKFVARRGFFAEVTRACTDTPRNYYGVNLARLVAYKSDPQLPSVRVEVSYVPQGGRSKTTFEMHVVARQDVTGQIVGIHDVKVSTRGVQHFIAERLPAVSWEAQRNNTPTILLLPRLFDIVIAPSVPLGTSRVTRERVRIVWQLVARMARDDFVSYQQLRDAFLLQYTGMLSDSNSSIVETRTKTRARRRDNDAISATSHGSTYVPF